MSQCKDCRHWVFCDWDPFNHECSLGHSTPDFGHTEACGDFEPLPDILGLGDDGGRLCNTVRSPEW
jgi:hypothetical protein